MTEVQRLTRMVVTLNAKLIELSDPDREQERIRTAYRRGYLAGRAAQRRGAAEIPNPELLARGDSRRALEGMAHDVR